MNNTIYKLLIFLHILCLSLNKMSWKKACHFRLSIHWTNLKLLKTSISFVDRSCLDSSMIDQQWLEIFQKRNVNPSAIFSSCFRKTRPHQVGGNLLLRPGCTCATPALHWCPAVQVFFDTVSNEIHKLSDTWWSQDNITKEGFVLQQLKKKKDLVIKYADKGMNVMIWPMDTYIKEVKRQLGNNDFYVILPSDPTEIFKKNLDLL